MWLNKCKFKVNFYRFADLDTNWNKLMVAYDYSRNWRAVEFLGLKSVNRKTKVAFLLYSLIITVFSI
ncbi:hypothetical protein ALTERO38_60903 [Alteromonas sp. 38]|nr:hypothetical protein ALTER154_30032 [Alteromonas sp. 154]VXC37012.1 hypothetical protein ALTERO38_60903 [Alteromonas sp. 38]